MTRRFRRILPQTAIALTVAIFMVAVSACSGKNKSVGDSDSIPATPQQILTKPAHFDAQTLDDYAAAIREGNERFDDTAMARMAMLCQASIDRLGNIVDNLIANDDPADSYNTLNELGSATWVRDTSLLLHYLRSNAHDQDLINRIGQLSSSCVHINATIGDIYRNQFGGKELDIVFPQ